jgi:chromosome segregation ATPase
MYMAASNFITKFQESMDRLTQVRQNIQVNIQLKEQFSNSLKSRLGEINGKIQQLGGLISSLKASADSLQNQVNSHSSAIGDKDKQLTEINARIQQLESEKANLANELNNVKQTLTPQIQQRQQKIDEMEAKIRELNAQNEAINKELQGKGDMQGQHAENIRILTDGHQKQITEIEKKNNQQINDLMGRINTQEKQIQDLQKELKEKDTKIASDAADVATI